MGVTADKFKPFNSNQQYTPRDVTETYSFERVAADGERFVPHRFRDGMYRVANPALGPTKHHAANQIAITADEIGGYLKRGYLLRMRGQISGQVNLVAASEIKER